jgi:hypothetical protein
MNLLALDSDAIGHRTADLKVDMVCDGSVPTPATPGCDLRDGDLALARRELGAEAGPPRGELGGELAGASASSGRARGELTARGLSWSGLR